MVSIKSYTSISVSNSSLISRLSACSGVSPSSIFPPGNSRCPLNYPYPLAVANILLFSCMESQITAATTLSPGKRMLFRLLSVLHRSHCLPARTGSESASLRCLLRLCRIPCRPRRSSSSLLRLLSSGCAVRLHCTGFPVSG